MVFKPDFGEELIQDLAAEKGYMSQDYVRQAMKLTPRPSWDQYFIDIAKSVAARATCPRAFVGAVLVKDNRILATGYNGSLPGSPHCIDEGCLLNEEGRFCKRVIHAEANVLYQAAKFGIVTSGTTLYFWDSRNRGIPCPQCLPALIASEISVVINRDLEKRAISYGTVTNH